MGRQGGRVQLKQSTLRLALNLAKMATEGLSLAATEEKKYVIEKSRGVVQAEKKWGVEFAGNKKVKASIPAHPAIIHQNQMSGCFPCQNGNAQNPQTHWRGTATGAPPPNQRSEQTLEPTQSPPSLPLSPTGYISGDTSRDMVSVLAGLMYSSAALPCEDCFNDVEVTQQDTHCDPDILTDEG
jgi:hypothetical protein